jgi:hypothetical protein
MTALKRTASKEGVVDRVDREVDDRALLNKSGQREGQASVVVREQVDHEHPQAVDEHMQLDAVASELGIAPNKVDINRDRTVDVADPATDGPLHIGRDLGGAEGRVGVHEDGVDQGDRAVGAVVNPPAIVRLVVDIHELEVIGREGRRDIPVVIAVEPAILALVPAVVRERIRDHKGVDRVGPQAGHRRAAQCCERSRAREDRHISHRTLPVWGPAHSVGSIQRGMCAMRVDLPAKSEESEEKARLPQPGQTIASLKTDLRGG